MKPKIKTTCTKLQLQLLSFCLLCLSGKTRCDGNGPAVVTVEQDSDAVLPCSLSSKENIESYRFDWRKAAQKDGGQKEVFYYDAGITYDIGRAGQSEEFKGRVSPFPQELKHGNASIIIRNTMVPDSGNYTCVFPRLQPPQTFHIKLVVGAAPKPSIEHLDETDNWALLQCEVHGNPQPKVEWRDSAGNKLPAQEPQFTQVDGRFYVTLNTIVTKTDRYRCVATQKDISHQIYTETIVRLNDPVLKDRTDENIPGAAPTPNIEHLDQTDNWALLQCKVHGNPQPEVEWRDSAGNTLPAEEPQVSERHGRLFITLNTIVTKTDRYRCVATQKIINHQIYAETFVRLNGWIGWIGWIVAGVLGTGGAAFALWRHKKKTPNNGSPADPNAGSEVLLKNQPSRSQETPDPEI